MQYVSAVNFVYGARFTAGWIEVISIWQHVRRDKMEYKVLKIAIGGFIFIGFFLLVLFYRTHNPLFADCIRIIIFLTVGYIFGYYGKYLDEE